MIDTNKFKSIIGKREKILNKLNSLEDSSYKTIVISVLNNLDFICNNFSDILDNVFQDNFRYRDYYDSKMSRQDKIEYFDDNYEGDDKEYRSFEFLMYCFINNLDELFGLADLDDFSDLNELLEMLDIGNYYDDMLEYSNLLVLSLQKNQFKTEKFEDDIELDFLNSDNKYMIYFTGFSLDDIASLPKNKRASLIRKLHNPLSTQVIIPNQESVDHVKSLYDLNLARIQFSDDYRISFVRYLNVTAIIGANFKSGHDRDYSRYDIIAKRKDKLYEEIENFRLGIVSRDSDHYKVIDILKDTIKNNGRKKD